MPELTLQSAMSSAFMDDFEDYAADSFALRDALRSVRAAFLFYPMLQTDKSGLYRDEAVGAGKFEKINEQSLRRTAAKIRAAVAGLGGENVYFSFIPDKSVYARRGYPGFDSAETARVLVEELPDFRRIDICGALSADSFYRTDFHWDQSRIGECARLLCSEMGAPLDAPPPESADFAGSFYGVYTGQLALPIGPDTMRYFSCDISARYLNADTLEWEFGDVYDFEAQGGDGDPYDFFLRGPQPLVVLENPGSNTDRELCIFRDSFASSLAPLLAQSYRKITLIDLRYINFSNAAALAQPSAAADILFLYSSLILNDPAALLIGG
jgi:hypothetical protein